MFGRKKEGFPKVTKVDTIISPDAQFKGIITTKGTIRIDGILDGGIDHAEGVIIGDSGEVKGDINAQNVVIGGKVEGNIASSSFIEVLPQAKIQGDLKTSKLSISEGAFFQGNCQMTKEQEVPEYEPEV